MKVQSMNPFPSNKRRQVRAIIKKLLHPAWQCIFYTREDFCHAVSNMASEKIAWDKLGDGQKDYVHQVIWGMAYRAWPENKVIHCIVWGDRVLFSCDPNNAIRHAIAKHENFKGISVYGFPLTDDEQDAWNRKNKAYKHYKGTLSTEDVL
jgi:hypothetical protein